MSQAYYCQEKQEIAQLNAEDERASARHRAEMAKIAQSWKELSDQWLELELRQTLFPGGIIKRD